MDDLDAKVQQASHAMSHLGPQINQIRRELSGIQEYLTQSMDGAITRSTEATNRGLQDAEALQQLLASLVKMAADSRSEAAFAHEQSIELVRRQTSKELEVFVNAMASTMASSASLQNQIVRLLWPLPYHRPADSYTGHVSRSGR